MLRFGTAICTPWISFRSNVSYLWGGSSDDDLLVSAPYGPSNSILFDSDCVHVGLGVSGGMVFRDDHSHQILGLQHVQLHEY